MTNNLNLPLLSFCEIKKLKGFGITLLLENIILNIDNCYIYVFQIFNENSYNKIGRITISSTNNKYSFLGTIGYFISKKHRGKNKATFACIIILKYLNSIGVDDIFVTANISNIASQKVIQKLNGVLVNTLDNKKIKKNVYSISTNINLDIYKNYTSDSTIVTEE
ncbi:MAG: GNAT family N-acetyltransferase [Defluviitaleaceae bacterium]|nr:GNAT family N-acetyltransferase [Defluviitaleaceae bacterium]